MVPLGAVLSVAVAWACALWSPIDFRLQAWRSSPGDNVERPSVVPESEWVVGGWHAGVFDADGFTRVSGPIKDLPPEQRMSYDTGPGRRFERLEDEVEPAWMAIFNSEPEKSGGRQEHFFAEVGFGLEITLFAIDSERTFRSANVVAQRSGWPFACAAASSWQDVGARSAAHPTLVRDGLSQPLKLHPDHSGWQTRWLPCRPLWSGLIGDTAFFGGVFLACGWAMAASLRSIRRRSGRCTSCGYDRSGLDSPSTPCPECGDVPATHCAPAPHP